MYRTRNDISSVFGLLNTAAIIIICSAKCPVPYFVAAGIDLNQPDILKAGAIRFCSSGNNIPAILGLLDAVCIVVFAATETFLPLCRSARCKLDHPGITSPHWTVVITEVTVI
ncbi:Uncharacterised protein [uncultured archaeon]|nr:Uncharacterised protein [uncultured archaeon]